MVRKVALMDFAKNLASTQRVDSLASERTVSTFAQIPLTALSRRTCQQLSYALNTKKLFRSEEGYERDWRGIAALSQQKSLCDEPSISGDDPTAKVLHYWCTNNAKTATFENLQRFLGIIDRWDVCDDIYDNMIKDATEYNNNNKVQQKSNACKDQQIEIDNFDSNDSFGIGSDTNILTKDDVLRAQQGLPPQKYDAFVLFADADIRYAVEMLTKLEESYEYNFKLCLKDRDLLAGVSFAHVALTQLIEERCKHLIVILTEEFLKSPENKFLVNYTQALQIQHRTRKIIPLLYEETVQVPRTLKIYTHLKYNANVGSLYNFWAKLAASIRNVTMVKEAGEGRVPNQQNRITTNSARNTLQQHKEVIGCEARPTNDISSINPKICSDDKGNKNDQKRCSLHPPVEQKQLLPENGLLLRNAHSTSQLNNAELCHESSKVGNDVNSSCSSVDNKKKKKWSSKLFKKVFHRSGGNRLQEA